MMIYFDSAASYPLLEDVKQDMLCSNDILFANPSSSHQLGIESSEIIEHSRQLIADAINALPSEIIFTSGATESNNLAIKGHFSLPDYQSKKHIIISAYEHKCIHAITDFLVRTSGVSVSVVKPNCDGIVSSLAVSELIRPETSLVSVMHVNNELGTVNPLKEIGQLCYKHNIRFHTDAAQSFMKEMVDVDELNIDYLSISAHKIGGPKGVGAIYIREKRNLMLEPVIHGAGQEDGLRGGTLATALIKAFGKAIESFPRNYAQILYQDFKSHLITILRELNVPYILNGHSIPSLVSVTLPDTDVQSLMRSTEDQFSLAVGSACSSKEIEASHVLTSIGLDRTTADKTLRLSFHHGNEYTDIEQLAVEIEKHTHT